MSIDRVTSASVLEKALQHQANRAAEYDNMSGERSVAKVVAMFNACHSTSMTEAQGWHFLQLLKQVRLFSAPGYHADSAEDNVSYASLLAECKARDESASN